MDRRKLSWFDRIVEHGHARRIERSGYPENPYEIIIVETTTALVIAAIGGPVRVRRWLRRKRLRRIKGTRRFKICRWAMWPDELQNIAKATYARVRRAKTKFTVLDRTTSPFFNLFRKNHNAP